MTFSKLPLFTRSALYLLFIFSTISIAGSETCLVFLYLFWLAELPQNRLLLSWKNPLFLGVVLFILAVVLSGVISPFPFQISTTLGNAWRWFTPFILVLTLDKIDLNKLLFIFFLSLIFISIYGVIQYFTGADWFRAAGHQLTAPYKHPTYSVYGNTGVFHAKGNFTHHLTFGGVLLLSAPIYWTLSSCEALSKKRRALYRVGFLVIGAAILAALARSVWLGSAVALVFLGLRLPKKIWISMILILGLFITVLVVHYSFSDQTLYGAPTGISLFWLRLVSGFIPKYNVDRLLMWKSAWEGIQFHPWFGMGLENDPYFLAAYRNSVATESGHIFFNSLRSGVHNLYLQQWLSLGVVGLTVYLGLAFLILNKLCRVLWIHRGENNIFISLIWGATAGLLGFMTAGFFENNFYDVEVQTMLLMMLGLAFYSVKKLTPASPSDSSS